MDISILPLSACLITSDLSLARLFRALRSCLVRFSLHSTGPRASNSCLVLLRYFSMAGLASGGFHADFGLNG